MQQLLIANQLHKAMYMGEGMIPILRDVSLTVTKGEFVIICGPSDSGKSILLYTLLGLERPNRGEVIIDGHNLYDMSEGERLSFRRQALGVMYRHMLSIGSLSVRENIEFAINLHTREGAGRRSVQELLDLTALSRVADAFPADLSSLQREQLSLARTLAGSPAMILGDDPTKDMNAADAHVFMDILTRLNQKGQTLLLVTTNEGDFRYGNHHIKMDRGAITSDSAIGSPASQPALEYMSAEF